MYFAKKTDSFQIPLYISLFQRLASGEQQQYEEIDEVIKEAKRVHKGELNIFSANNRYFFFVSFLSTNSGSFLDNLDENAISTNTYQKIAEILEENSTSN